MWESVGCGLRRSSRFWLIFYFVISQNADICIRESLLQTKYHESPHGNSANGDIFVLMVPVAALVCAGMALY